MNHTPGPWVARKPPNDVEARKHHVAWVDCYSQAGHSLPIAEVRDIGDASIANAALIAAAPALLSAVLGLLRDTDPAEMAEHDTGNCPDMVGEVGVCAVCAARAAVAAAGAGL